MAMRKFQRTKKDGTAYGEAFPEKISAHLNEVLIIKGFKIENTERYGDVVIIDTDKGKMSTFSGVVRGQLEDESKKGFPIQAKFAKVKNYVSMIEP
jgi:hypothetical protein